MTDVLDVEIATVVPAGGARRVAAIAVFVGSAAALVLALRRERWPVVIKADGLAAGKGVLIDKPLAGNLGVFLAADAVTFYVAFGGPGEDSLYGASGSGGSIKKGDGSA